MVHIGNSWDDVLKEDFESENYQNLRKFLATEYRTRVIYPDMHDIFNALKYTPYEKVKVVILGQDPYHEPGQAMGLSFSVPEGIAPPPSLINIFREIESDLGKPAARTGDLTRWAMQGVLLLNATLTVRAHVANSHQRLGWTTFTDAAIKSLSDNREHIVFMLWGGFARSKAYLIDKTRHLVLECAHPSPLSANRGGWFGNRHFSRCNAYLAQYGIAPIEW